MDYQQLQAYQQQILNQALNEGLRRNSEQTKIWTDYKKRHVKVIEGLKVLPNNLSVNCMVPIGKKALMKGKIVHTNEIMVCLGDGYFVKYSAPQAIELCNRRIKKADEMINEYKKEKDLLEMRKMVPEGFDSFGNDEVKDYFEPCYDEVKPKGSRIAHVAKYKECEKKLNDLRNKKTEDDQSDEDLFSRLDALELEEELKDELERLEDEYPDYHQLYLEGYEDESEVDSDDDSYQSDYSEDAINEIPHKKLSKINHRLQVLNNANSFDDESIMEPINFFEAHALSTTNINKSDDKTEVREKKVVFAEPQVKYFTNEDEEEEEEEEKINIVNEKRRISVIEQRIYECSKQDDDSDDEIEDADTSIEYHHEENIVSDTDDNQTPTSHDIQSLPTPKSILKKRLDVNINQQSLASSASSITTVEEEIDDQQEELVSAYTTIVKDITEHAELKMPSQIKEEVEQKRPVSKFKMERAGALRK